MVKYIKVSDSNPVVDHLVGAIERSLRDGGRVFWLVAGGSAISIAVDVGRRLAGTNVENLFVTLTDERYGENGHADSNWRQLIDAEFSIPGAQLLPVLTGNEFEETTRIYSENLKTQLASADYSIGLFGMGTDGHTAGILPGSSATDSSDFAAAYQADDYARITMTPAAIAQLNEAVLHAVGSGKVKALEDLEKDLTLSEQPAQVLKQLHGLTIYNDHKGDEI